MAPLRWSVMAQAPYRDMLVEGLGITLVLVVTTTVFSLASGSALAVARTHRTSAVRRLAHAVVETLRNVPGVFWLLFWFILVPVLVPDPLGEKLNGLPHYPLIAAILGLTFNNTPYVADIVWAAVASTREEAISAAKLAGFSRWGVWRRVILPEAVVASLPALNARLTHNVKNTSLAMVISVHDLTWQAQEIEAVTFAGLEVTTVVTLAYVVLALSFSTSLRWVEAAARTRRRR